MNNEVINNNSSTVYIYHTHTQFYSSGLIEYLSDSEQEKLQTITNEKRRKVFVLGRALLAKSLEKHTGDRHYQLEYQHQGKPELITPHHWHFNISHSGEYIFLALRKNFPVGIDCEIVRKCNYEKIAENFFSQQEIIDIKQSNNPQLSFFTLWTQYEAQIKQLGLSVFSSLPNNEGDNKRYVLSDTLNFSDNEKLVYSISSSNNFDSKVIPFPRNEAT